MKRNIETATFTKPPALNVQRSPLTVFLENIELQLLDQLRDAELEWENICQAKTTMRTFEKRGSWNELQGNQNRTSLKISMFNFLFQNDITCLNFVNSEHLLA